jgi:hypothetical protein
MEMGPDVAILRERTHPLDRLVRVALVIYLSPVILVVFAIGLIGDRFVAFGLTQG